MIKLKNRITNPMTIIAIFATLSETSAAVSLPFLDDEDREIYVWFIISFPFYLLFLFFATLNFNYRSLYSPSDFEKDEHFLKAMDSIESQRNNASVTDLLPTSATGNSLVSPDEIGLQPARATQSAIHLPELLKTLRIIDARRIKTKVEFGSLLGKAQNQERQLILFLTGTKSERLLKENVFKHSRRAKKGGSASFCVAYNLNSHGVTVMDPNCQLASNQQ
jgi:hypothetical protein